MKPEKITPVLSVDLIHRLAQERRDRGEDQDPLMAMSDALRAGETVPKEEISIILDAHNNGPWVIDTDKKFTIFSKWCNKCGSPIKLSQSNTINGIKIYTDDFGDCVMRESSVGMDFAVWTRKNRLCVGFRNQEDAILFRSTNPEFSMENTKNTRVGLLIIENGDNPETIQKVTKLLNKGY